MKTQLIPTDFIAAVNDIKLAILQARARAAQVSNVEALKLYFFVGGYISKKTRSAKWGTGAIHALSERLQVELPGLRGFSSSGIKRMRSFYEAWSPHLIIRPTALGEIRHLASDEFGARDESGSHIISGVTCGTQMIKNPSNATVRRIMKENDVVQSAIQLANSGYSIKAPLCGNLPIGCR